MKSIDSKPLTFPIAGKEYTIPPVGWDCGLALTKYLEMNTAALGKVKTKSDVLFKLAMSDAVWDQMVADNVATHLMFRAGMASLAHFKMLTDGSSDEMALAAAETVWESGIDPETLAAQMAAKLKLHAGTTTSPSTAKGQSSTRRRASTSRTTSTRRNPKASRSTGAKS